MNQYEIDSELLNVLVSELQENVTEIKWNTNSPIRYGKKDRCFYQAWTNTGVPAAIYGDWSADEQYRTWKCEKLFSNLDHAQRAQWLIQIDKHRVELQKQKEESQAKAAKQCQESWEQMEWVEDDHPYLARKNIGAYGVKVDDKGNLVCPVMDTNRNIISLQYIDADGNKRFHYQGKVKGGFGAIGLARPKRSIYLCEGYATACSIHEATECMTVYAFSANNIYPVAKELASKIGIDYKEVVVVADIDASGVGQREANKCKDIVGCRVILLPFPEGDANDYINSDYNNEIPLRDILLEKNKDWLTLYDFVNEVDEVEEWLISKVIPSESLCMLFGQSGTGKSFVALDMALSLSTGLYSEWHGYKVDSNRLSIAYLAGEGRRGLKKRIRGWLSDNNIKPSDPSTKDVKFIISNHGDNLDKPEGLTNVIRYLDEVDSNIDLIIIDTLHRFMSGNENSSQDTATVLNACSELQKKYKCTILLVHHSGVLSKDRARGSSSWKAALDMEFRIDMDEEKVITLTHTKAKDSEFIPEKKFVLVDAYTEQVNTDGNPVFTKVIKEATGNVALQQEILQKENPDYKWEDVCKWTRIWMEYWTVLGGGTMEHNGAMVRFINIQDAKQRLPSLIGKSKDTIGQGFSPSRPLRGVLREHSVITEDDHDNLIALPKMDNVISRPEYTQQ